MNNNSDDMSKRNLLKTPVLHWTLEAHRESRYNIFCTAVAKFLDKFLYFVVIYKTTGVMQMK